MTGAPFGGNDLLAHCSHMYVWTFHPSDSDPLSAAWVLWAVSSEMEMSCLESAKFPLSSVINRKYFKYAWGGLIFSNQH